MFKNHITVIEKKYIAIHIDIELLSSPNDELLAPQSEQMKHNKCCHCFQRWMPAVWECNVSHVRQLYRNTLMTDFAQAFQNDQNNILDAVQRDRSTG